MSFITNRDGEHSVVLILRVYAMYGCNRKLLAVLLTLGGASMIAECFLVTFTIVQLNCKLAFILSTLCYSQYVRGSLQLYTYPSFQDA